MSTLPNNEDARKKIQNAIEEIVEAEVVKADKNSYISDVCSRLKDETGIEPTDLKKRAKIRYKQLYKSEAYEKEKEAAETMYDENEILFKS